MSLARSTSSRARRPSARPDRAWRGWAWPPSRRAASPPPCPRAAAFAPRRATRSGWGGLRRPRRSAAAPAPSSHCARGRAPAACGARAAAPPAPARARRSAPARAATPPARPAPSRAPPATLAALPLACAQNPAPARSGPGGAACRRSQRRAAGAGRARRRPHRRLPLRLRLLFAHPLASPACPWILCPAATTRGAACFYSARASRPWAARAALRQRPC